MSKKNEAKPEIPKDILSLIQNGVAVKHAVLKATARAIGGEPETEFHTEQLDGLKKSRKASEMWFIPSALIIIQEGHYVIIVPAGTVKYVRP